MVEPPNTSSFRSKAYLPGECKICDLLDKCGGGCPLSCGTLKDHDVDQLYIQRIQKEAVGDYLPSAPSGAGYSRPTVRYAYPGDLESIVKLEADIFGNSAPLFKSGKIEQLFQHCPKAFRVVAKGEELLGYSVLFPLSEAGVTQVQTNFCHSVQEMGLNGLGKRFGDRVVGYYLEVIATVKDAPTLARLSLIRDFFRTLRERPAPVFTCPVSEAGMRLARKGGFVSLGRSPNNGVYVLPHVREKETAFSATYE